MTTSPEPLSPPEAHDAVPIATAADAPAEPKSGPPIALIAAGVAVVGGLLWWKFGRKR